MKILIFILFLNINIFAIQTAYEFKVNKHGIILKHKDTLETVYIGKDCDTFSKKYGKGYWTIAKDNSLRVYFNNNKFKTFINQTFFSNLNATEKCVETLNNNSTKKNNDEIAISSLSLLLLNSSNLTYQGYDHDYGLGNGGLRTTYNYLKSFISYKSLLNLSPYPIFISGPHYEEGFNFHARDFGHYNPKFLDWLYARLQNTLENDVFVEFTKSIFKKYYDSHLKHYIEIYNILEEEKKEVQEIIQSGRITYYTTYEEVRSNISYKYYESNFYIKVLDAKSNYQNYYEHNQKSIVHFWFRRYSDGTHKKIYKILNLFNEKYNRKDFPVPLGQ